MDKKLYIKMSMYILVFCAFLFSPILIINGTSRSIFDCVFFAGFSWYILLISLFFISNIASLYIIVFNRKITKLVPFIFSLISVVIFFISPYVITLDNRLIIKSVDFAGSSIVQIGTAIAIMLFSLSSLFDELTFTIKDIVEIAIFVGFALVLDMSFLKIKMFATGGSISLACLPLIIMAMRKGFGKSFIGCGLIYGFISCLIDGYGLFTFPFDYLLGFGSFAVIGLFKKQIDSERVSKSIIFLIVGILISGVLRVFSGTVSGMIFYNLKFGPSIVYQLTYMGPSLGICLAATLLLYPAIRKINLRYK